MKTYQIIILIILLFGHLLMVGCKKEKFFPAGAANKSREYFNGNVSQVGKSSVKAPVFHIWLDNGLDVDWEGTGLHDPNVNNIFRGYLTVRVPGKVRENIYQNYGSIGNPMQENIAPGNYILAVTIDHQGRPSTMIKRFLLKPGQKVDIVARFPRHPKTVEEFAGSCKPSKL